jgi:Tol biopolymer transport system component
MIFCKQVALLVLTLGLVVLLSSSIDAATKPTTTGVSLPGWTQGDGDSSGNNDTPVISADGRYIAFASNASNFSSIDYGSDSDIFVFDRQTRMISMVSVASDGTVGNGISTHPAISADGRYIAFQSLATNLVANDTNNDYDVFLHDCLTNETKLVSSTSNQYPPAIGRSISPSVSADGRYVAFTSDASNLVLLSDFNSTSDVYRRDMQTGATILVSAQTNSTSGNLRSGTPKISGDGRYVAFVSSATNLVSNSDTNGALDVFVRDCQSGTTTLVSESYNGHAGNSTSQDPGISRDGRYVSLTSYAGNLVTNDNNSVTDIYVRDIVTHSTTRASFAPDGNEWDRHSFNPSISANGRYLSYTTYGTDGVNNQNVKGNHDSTYSTISANGKYVVFESDSTNLVTGDSNGFKDVFLRGPLTDFPWPMFLPAITGKM